MTFSAKNMIKQRKSVRTFDGKPLSDADRKSLEAFVSSMDNPFGVPVEFRLLEAKENRLSSPVIVGEAAYLAAKVRRVEHFEIAYGYSFEKACLFAQSLGIGTVMLAASLSRSTFEKAMDVQVIDRYVYHMLRCICSRYKRFIQRGDCNDIFGKRHDKAEKERQDV